MLLLGSRTEGRWEGSRVREEEGGARDASWAPEIDDLCGSWCRELEGLWAVLAPGWTVMSPNALFRSTVGAPAGGACVLDTRFVGIFGVSCLLLWEPLEYVSRVYSEFKEIGKAGNMKVDEGE